MPQIISKLFALLVQFLPLRAGLLNELGVAALNSGRNEIAAAFFSLAIKRDPTHGLAIYNLGCVSRAQGNFDRAVACFEKTLELGVMGVEPENELGVIHLKQGNLDQAREHFQRVLSLIPAHANALVNLGHVLAALGFRDEALARYSSAKDVQSDHADAHFGMAVEYLIQGHFRPGWQEYEWRFEGSEGRRLRLAPPSPSARRWQGENLNGKSILLREEQGLGDTIQFCRFVHQLRSMGANVYLSVRESLFDLLSRSFEGGAKVCVMGEERQFEPYEYWSPLLSVTRLLEVSLHNIPDTVPYLHANEAGIQRWKKKLDSGNGSLRVGIVWRGNPTHENDRHRSLPLEQLDCLANPDCTFFSLQLGIGKRQLAKSALAPISLGGQLRNFAETAAVVSNLDLVIAVDTSVAHLAGALGRPVWVLLPFNCDWRWLLDRTDTPWYPTMRLYRQSDYGRWQPTVERLARDLEKLAGRRNG